MADLSFDWTSGGGGAYNVSPDIYGDNSYSGGGYVPPGGGGYTVSNPNTPGFSDYGVSNQDLTLQRQLASTFTHSAYDSSYFTTNLNSSNPYVQSITLSMATDATNPFSGSALYQSIINSGNKYDIVGYRAGNDNYVTLIKLTVYNNAYIEFENKAVSAQNTYLSQQQTNFDAVNDKASSDLITSYGNAVPKPQFKDDISLLGELNNLKNQLQFQDDITKYLNRVPDSSNINAINDLKNQIAALENSLSDRLADYYRQQEIIRAKEREAFTWDFAWLSDPYFGRGGGQLYPQYLQAQAYLSNNIAMISDGSIYDWLAGGMYLNAVMPGGDMSAGYMPNDYYSVGLQYQVPGTNLNEGGANAFPWDSMAGGASFGLNSSGRAAYKVLEW